MKKRWIGIATLALALLVSFSGTAVLAEGPANFDENGSMPLITEPDGSATPLIFCRGNDDLTMDSVNWVDDGQGKAVRFNGVDEYFRIGYNHIQLTEFTLSMWVKWEGASQAEGGSVELNQRIFSARGAYRDRQFITFSPKETTADGTDVLRLRMQYEGSDWALVPSEADSLEQNNWHHVAVMGDGRTLRLYLDGKLVAEELTMMSLATMRPQQLYLGKGPTSGGDGYFNGLMDNVYLYNKVIDDEALNTLIEEQCPDELITTTPPTTTTTQAVATETSPTIQQTDYSLPAIPPVVWIVTGVVAALIVTFIVVENVRYAKEKRPPTE